jgi:hypothetical protein
VVQLGEVEIPSAEDVERAGLDGKQVQRINVPPQVEQCLCLDRIGIFLRNRAHGKSDRQRLIVVESKA